jgi:hypothetical protein
MASDMALPIIIIIGSTALLMFYLRANCEVILRREFDDEFFKSVVNANRMEFPFVRQVLEEFDVPLDYERVRVQLKCDSWPLLTCLRRSDGFPLMSGC